MQKLLRYFRSMVSVTLFQNTSARQKWMTLTVRFRVGAVYKNCAIATYFDDQLISKRKRPVMAPGEMEQVILDKKKLNEHPDLSKITIKIEEA